MRFILLIFISSITLSCNKHKDDNFDFKKETGLTEDEFYDFLINDYSKRLDTLSSKKIRTLYSYLAWPIKIEFENGMPTELEPPGVDFKTVKTYRLDQNRLKDFKIISNDTYTKAEKGMLNDDCKEFERDIGEYIVLLHLPWYNPKDSSLLMREVWTTCPPHYHQGGGVLGRYKKRDGHWTLDFNLD
jgi:hypothetical protein